jgi:hypothetical protein
MGRTIPIPKPNIIITSGATYAEYIAEEIKKLAGNVSSQIEKSPI